MIYVDLLLVTFVVTYIVDVSGFTESWRGVIERMLPKGQRLGHIRPFDCSACMSWWSCVIYSAIVGDLTLPVVAWSALMSLLSSPIAGVLVLLRETLASVVRKTMNKID